MPLNQLFPAKLDRSREGKGSISSRLAAPEGFRTAEGSLVIESGTQQRAQDHSSG